MSDEKKNPEQPKIDSLKDYSKQFPIKIEPKQPVKESSWVSSKRG